MRRVSANKNVLSSRLNSVRQMFAVAVQRADCSTAVVRQPQNLYRGTLTVFGGPCMCGHQLIGDADILRPWGVGSRRIGTVGRGSGVTCTPAPWV